MSIPYAIPSDPPVPPRHGLAHEPIGVYRRADLLAGGMTDSLISAALRDGQFIRIRHGIFADAQAMLTAGPADIHVAHIRAAILAAREPIFASGPSAALLHGLPLPWVAPNRVFLARTTRQDQRSLRRPSRHRLTIADMHVTSHQFAQVPTDIVQGIPTVSAPTAAITSLPFVEFWHKIGLLDAVRWATKIKPEDLVSLAHEWRHLGGFVAAVDAIELSRFGAQNYFETYSRLALMREGLPEPQLQVEFRDAAGQIGIVDMYWPGLRVIGEADGAIKYESRANLVAEKRREDRLRALGLSVVRWMWDDIRSHPDRVANHIRRGMWASAS